MQKYHLCLYESKAESMRWRALFKSASSNKKFGPSPAVVAFTNEFRLCQQAQYAK